MLSSRARGENRRVQRTVARAPVERHPAARARFRMLLVSGVVLGFLLVCTGVSGYLQIAQQEVFQTEAQRNYLRAVLLDDRRGNIYDRNGALLATSVDAPSVFALPERVEKQSETAALLAEVLEMPADEVFDKLLLDRKFVYIKRKVTTSQAQRIRDMELPGIRAEPEAKRYYPERELAGQVLGLVGLDPVGLEGVEKAFDGHLRGRNLQIQALKDARGRLVFTDPLPAGTRFAGHDVVLTIDERLQGEVERILERTVIAHRALHGVAIVIDVPTGDILAMANVPRFNPNNFHRYPLERRRNRAVSDTYEPGSVLKVFTLAAALEVEAVTMDDLIDVENGRMRIGPHAIHDTHPHDVLSVWDIIKVSSNIGAAKIAAAAGKRQLFNTFVDFGFAQPPGSGLVGETPGSLRPVRDWGGVTFANISFGQGISVSPLQMAVALAALANGGKRLRPHIVHEIRASDGTLVKRYEPEVVCQVVRPEVAATVLESMQRVVEPGGTGEAAALDRYLVAGKTGTSQKADTLVGGYSPFRWIASFGGVVPADAPRLAILVVVDEPMGKACGGTVAAPAFREMAEWALQYFQIPPPGQPLARMRAQVTLADGEPAGRRAGAPPAPVSAAEQEGPAAVGSGDEALPDAPEVYVPDFQGLTVVEVQRLARAQRLRVAVRDGGIAVQQSLPPSARVAAGSVVEVRFEPSWGERRQGAKP